MKSSTRLFLISFCALAAIGQPCAARALTASSAPLASDPDADFDNDGLTNQEEADFGTLPNEGGGDSDGDGVIDGEDGYALTPRLSPPRVPESRYAVIDLQTLGLPAGALVVGVDKEVNVFYRELYGEFPESHHKISCLILETGDSEVLYHGIAWAFGALSPDFCFSDGGWAVWHHGDSFSSPQMAMIYNRPAGFYRWKKGKDVQKMDPLVESVPTGESRMLTTMSRSTAINNDGVVVGLIWCNGASPDWAAVYGSGNAESGTAHFGFRWNALTTTAQRIGDVRYARTVRTNGQSVSTQHGPPMFFSTVMSTAPLRIFGMKDDVWGTTPDIPAWYFQGSVTDFPSNVLIDSPKMTSDGNLLLYRDNQGQTQRFATLEANWQTFPLEVWDASSSTVTDEYEVTALTDRREILTPQGELVRNGRIVPRETLIFDTQTLGTPVSINSLGAIVTSDGKLLLPFDMAVDANRDGVIKFAGNPSATGAQDKTEESKPFRFWCNDDDDHVGTKEEDRVPVVQADSQDDQIDGRRDLEDFTRLFIHLGAFHQDLVNGTMKVGLKWKDTNGTTPRVKLYRMADVNGSDDYLKEDAAAIAQVSGVFRDAIGEVSGTGTLVLPATVFANYSVSNPQAHLLFEASGEGKGQLCITIHKANGEEIGEGPGVWLDLLNVKKMYQRAHAVPDFADNPFSHMGSWSPPAIGSAPYDNGHAFSEPDNEGKKAVVYVHGINGPSGQSDAYSTWQADSETVFKRLWHQGFKGRFASFKWLALTPAWPFKFNESEYRGWKSGQGLAQFLGTLPSGYQKNLYSFSQGAIVCGSALTVYQASVQNYVMSQAAAPAGCYDTSTAINSYTDFLNAEATLPTPDGTNDLGYRGYLSGLNVAGSVVSFFNQVDYALKSGREFGINVSWEGNQLLSKPNQNLFGRTYAYDSGPPSNPFPVGQRCFLRDVGLPFNERRLTDIHESMSFVARPRSEAAGANNAVAGRISGRYNVGPGSPSAFDRDNTDHGGQFSRRIQQTQDYYENLLNVFTGE